MNTIPPNKKPTQINFTHQLNLSNIKEYHLQTTKDSFISEDSLEATEPFSKSKQLFKKNEILSSFFPISQRKAKKNKENKENPYEDEEKTAKLDRKQISYMNSIRNISFTSKNDTIWLGCYVEYMELDDMNSILHLSGQSLYYKDNEYDNNINDYMDNTVKDEELVFENKTSRLVDFKGCRISHIGEEFSCVDRTDNPYDSVVMRVYNMNIKDFDVLIGYIISRYSSISINDKVRKSIEKEIRLINVNETCQISDNLYIKCIGYYMNQKIFSIISKSKQSTANHKEKPKNTSKQLVTKSKIDKFLKTYIKSLYLLYVSNQIDNNIDHKIKSLLSITSIATLYLSVKSLKERIIKIFSSELSLSSSIYSLLSSNNDKNDLNKIKNSSMTHNTTVSKMSKMSRVSKEGVVIETNISNFNKEYRCFNNSQNEYGKSCLPYNLNLNPSHGNYSNKNKSNTTNNIYVVMHRHYYDDSMSIENSSKSSSILSNKNRNFKKMMRINSKKASKDKKSQGNDYDYKSILSNNEILIEENKSNYLYNYNMKTPEKKIKNNRYIQ